MEKEAFIALARRLALTLARNRARGQAMARGVANDVAYLQKTRRGLPGTPLKPVWPNPAARIESIPHKRLRKLPSKSLKDMYRSLEDLTPAARSQIERKARSLQPKWTTSDLKQFNILDHSDDILNILTARTDKAIQTASRVGLSGMAAGAGMLARPSVEKLVAKVKGIFNER